MQQNVCFLPSPQLSSSAKLQVTAALYVPVGSDGRLLKDRAVSEKPLWWESKTRVDSCKVSHHVKPSTSNVHLNQVRVPTRPMTLKPKIPDPDLFTIWVARLREQIFILLCWSLLLLGDRGCSVLPNQNWCVVLVLFSLEIEVQVSPLSQCLAVSQISQQVAPLPNKFKV